MKEVHRMYGYDVYVDIDINRVVYLIKNGELCYPFRWNKKTLTYDGMIGHYTIGGLRNALRRGTVSIF